MRILLISQICCVVLGGSNSLSLRFWRVPSCLDAVLVTRQISSPLADTNRAEYRQSPTFTRTLPFTKTFSWQTTVGRVNLYLSREYPANVMQYTRTYSLSRFRTGRKLGMWDAFVARDRDSRASFQNDQSTRQRPPFTFPKFDEYGDLSYSKEKERLDYFAKELTTVSDESGYIIEYRTNRQSKKPMARAKRAKDYLVKVKGIDAKRIIVVNGGYQKRFKIELRLGPVKSK